ncbi:hypothetical protein ASF47_14075 [Nocardioides sp. Leaf285]|nr:hypothetical protein ASF47_14075 [Nocardioides sp. Leaf285]
MVAWVAGFTLAAEVGLHTRPPGSPIALFWPAAAVAVAWLVLRPGRSDRAVALVAMGAVLAVEASTVFEAPSGVALTVLAHLALCGGCTVGLEVTTRRRGRLRHHDLLTALRSSAGLVALAASALAASAATAPVIGAAVLADGGGWSWETVVAWTGRSSVTVTVLVGTLVALRRAPTARAPQEGTGLRWGYHLLGPTGRARARSTSRLEYAALVATTAAVLALIYGVASQLPIAFVLMAVAAWAGTRFSPEAAAVHVTGTALVLVALTSQGLGVLAAVDDPLLRALVAQLFVGTCFVLAMLLAYGEERHGLLAARLLASEAAARSQAELLGAVTSSMADALVVLDADGTVVLSNHTADALLAGSTAINMADPGQHGFHLPDGTPIRLDDGLHTRALGGETILGELVQHVDSGTGERTFHSVSGAPLPTASGRRVAVFLLRDVTREQMHLRQVQGFAGMVAHDLKSPLASLAGWHQLLADELERLGADADDAASMNRRIGSSTRRMELLIDDLLGYASAQAATHHPEPVDLDTVVAEVLADRHDLRPGTVVCDTAATLTADPVQLRQVMANLLGNALKYVAPDTAPRVTVSARSTHGWDEVVVDDNGVGIPAGQHEAVFDPFVRMHSGYEGTGLGLAICRTVAVKHGGSLTARPGPTGTGTRMVLRLPHQAAVPVSSARRPPGRPPTAARTRSRRGSGPRPGTSARSPVATTSAARHGAARGGTGRHGAARWVAPAQVGAHAPVLRPERPLHRLTPVAPPRRREPDPPAGAVAWRTSRNHRDGPSGRAPLVLDDRRRHDLHPGHHHGPPRRARHHRGAAGHRGPGAARSLHRGRRDPSRRVGGR